MLRKCDVNKINVNWVCFQVSKNIFFHCSDYFQSPEHGKLDEYRTSFQEYMNFVDIRILISWDLMYYIRGLIFFLFFLRNKEKSYISKRMPRVNKGVVNFSFLIGRTQFVKLQEPSLNISRMGPFPYYSRAKRLIEAPSVTTDGTLIELLAPQGALCIYTHTYIASHKKNVGLMNPLYIGFRRLVHLWSKTLLKREREALSIQKYIVRSTFNSPLGPLRPRS